MGGAVFYEKVTAARDASFKDTLHAAVSFIKSFLFYRHATSSERSAPTFPSRGRHSSRHFMPFTVLFATVLLLSRSTKKLFCGAQRRGTKPPPGGINGFNAVKARRDGIERIQEVSGCAARDRFGDLQPFSATATKPTADAPPKNPKQHQREEDSSSSSNTLYATFPTNVFGSSSRNSISFGRAYFAICFLQ